MTDDPIRLVDMQAHSGVPNGVEYGESWRSKRVYQCPVCHTMTNKWVNGGYPSRGPRLRCPANIPTGETVYERLENDERHDKHEELSTLRDRRAELNQRLEQYRSAGEAAKRVVSRLEDERTVIDQRITELREWFDGQFDDVRGIERPWDPISFTATTP